MHHSVRYVWLFGLWWPVDGDAHFDWLLYLLTGQVGLNESSKHKLLACCVHCSFFAQLLQNDRLYILAQWNRPHRDDLQSSEHSYPSCDANIGRLNSSYEIMAKLESQPKQQVYTICDVPSANGINNQYDASTKRWKDLSTKTKIQKIIRTIILLILLLACLYFFICSLDLMTDGFKLLGGHTIADAFRSNTILKSPVAILMIGIVVTAILQSSSTVTSIAVVMVGAEAFTVEQAYYVIMGSNVGTAVTSTIVALFSSGDRGRFEKAFAAAVIHDLYNWMGVVVLFPLEVITSALFGQGAIVSLTGLMVKNLELGTLQDSEFFQKIIDPFTHLIFQADDEVLTNRSLGIVTNQSVVKRICYDSLNHTYSCPFVLNLDWPDTSIGGLLLFISLVLLICCLSGMVKVLNQLLGGGMQRILQKSLNFQLRGRWSWATGYICILLGAMVTLVVQSSSIVCSTMIPLVALDVLSLERFWVYEVGADVGTTGTAIFAALATETLKTPLQLAFCHFCFNFISIFLFYSIPPVRRIPLAAAAFLGRTSARYRWFAFVYIFGTFIIFPLIVFGLAYAGWIYPIIFAFLVIFLCSTIKIISVLQKRRPHCLPRWLRTWDFLPPPLRSLDYYDHLFTCRCIRRVSDENVNSEQDVVKMRKL
ncbi:Sodium-dependent phosphate transport protein 2A [Trichinella nelsoni]|uniref:Sodium-dependent phosphate transport protein 2A n=1 Tax=Trichinella nelsoni TaxID=6336 RepID=A0A0V0SBL0_9BILA|nr:Sodium-dependent phosphate transport protein 2A [Trichinella nelsoni]KRZ90293.1 Sodium-dependent phosphate transport protein 2A [Trichinella sp. T8]